MSYLYSALPIPFLALWLHKSKTRDLQLSPTSASLLSSQTPRRLVLSRLRCLLFVVYPRSNNATSLYIRLYIPVVRKAWHTNSTIRAQTTDPIIISTILKSRGSNLGLSVIQVSVFILSIPYYTFYFILVLVIFALSLRFVFGYIHTNGATESNLQHE